MRQLLLMATSLTRFAEKFKENMKKTFEKYMTYWHISRIWYVSHAYLTDYCCKFMPPVFVEFSPHLNPPPLTDRNCCPRVGSWGDFYFVGPSHRFFTSKCSWYFVFLKVPSDSESSRRPSNISVCPSDYSGILFSQIWERNVDNILI